MGYHDVSVHGSKIYQTPNIDKLATESVSFSKAYANYPRCVPSRFSMMTGNYPIQNGSVPDDGYKISDVTKNKNFVKRKEYEILVDEYFKNKKSAIVIQGVGGIGKTQIAKSYAYSKKDNYDFIWWINSKSSFVWMSNNATPIVLVLTSNPRTLGESFLIFFAIIRNLI